MLIFCKHKWERIHFHTHRSAIEQLGQAQSIDNAPPWAFRKKHLAVFTCKECGKLKVVRQE